MTTVIISFEKAGLEITVLAMIIVVGITYLTLLLINPINKILVISCKLFYLLNLIGRFIF